MDINAYFGLSDTPAQHSPVGKLMVSILAKKPGTSFEQARAEANRLLEHAAGKRFYSLPRVFSADEQLREKTRLRNAFGRPKAPQRIAYSPAQLTFQP